MASSDRIARNTAFLTLASVLQKILSFAYFAYLSRAFESDIGRYVYALNVTSLFIIFMDFGLGQLLTREGAKDEENLQKHITELWSIKAVLILIAAVLCVLYAFGSDALFANVDAIDRNLILVGTAVILVDTVTFTIFSIFRALRQLQWEALSIVLYQAVIVSLGFLAVQQGLPVIFAILALLCGSLSQVLFLWGVLYLRTPLRLKLRLPLNMSLARKTLLIAAPFAVAGIIYRLTGTIDSMMLKIIDGNFAAGAYGLAFKLTFALTVLPGAFATSYYPAMSAYVHQKSPKLKEVFENAMVYMALLSAPIAAGVFILGGTIIQKVWGDFWMPAATALSILITGLPFVFFNYPVGNLLNAAGKQRVNTMNMGIALLVNVALNSWLIPRYSYNGAAVASLISGALLVGLGLPWVHRIVQFSWLRLLFLILRVLLAALIMAAIVYWIQYTYALPIVIIIAVFVYAAALFFVRVVTAADILRIVQQIRKRVS